MHYDYLLSACVNNDVHIDIFEAGMMHSCEVCQEKILVTYHIGGLIICFQSSTGSLSEDGVKREMHKVKPLK